MHFCFTIPAFPNGRKKQFQNQYFIPFINDFCIIIIICQQSSWAADNIGIFFATEQGQ